MTSAQPIEARYGRLHNVSMAVVSCAMMALVIAHFVANPGNAPALSLDDPRFVLFLMLAMAMLYYVFLGVSRALKREPQLVIDHDGIMLGFGRNRRFAWSDIVWVRLRRMAIRPQLEISLAEQAFIAADLRLSMWSFDDALRPMRGQPTTVVVRDNGLDTRAGAMLDAVRAFRPNLVKS